jgi:hypothetical protein
MAMAWEGAFAHCAEALRLHAIYYGSSVVSAVKIWGGAVVRGEPQVVLLCGIIHTHTFIP